MGSAGALDRFIDKKIKYGRNHFDAIKKNKSFKLVKLVDKNINSILKKKLQIIKNITFEKKLSEYEKEVDLIVICTPTESHFNDIKKALKLNPKIIICEKPLSNKIKETIEILEILEKKRIKLIINYQRQFDNRFKELGKLFIKNKYNKFILKYNNGFLNNASHFLYFLYELFGKIKKINKNYNLNYKNKKSLNFRIDFENYIEAHGIEFDNYSFDIFEIEAYNQYSRINIMDGGYYLEYYKKKENTFFNNYSPLIKSKLKLSDYGDGFDNLYNRVSEFFKGKDDLNEFNSKKYSYFYKQLSKIKINEK